MTTIQEWLAIDLAEVATLVRRIDEAEAAGLAQAIRRAERVFVAGQGRTGLVMRMFALRLMQLGLRVHVVGDAVTPPIGRGDLLVVGSASGETPSAAGAAQRAKQLGATVAALTARRESAVGRAADVVVMLAGSTPKIEGAMGTRLPLASALEQVYLIFLDSVIATLAAQLGQSNDDMMARHANLE